MKILCTELFEEQLKTILSTFAEEDFEATKKFKLYLDTIIINLPTKAEKYKKAALFDDENIKEIPHEEYIILFFINKISNTYLILSIFKK